VLTPSATEAELRRLAKKLEDRTDVLAELLQTAAEADVTYRVSFAKALLDAKGKTVAEREAHATLFTSGELYERKTTEAVADACREAVRSLRDQLSAVQSVNANLRHAAGLDR
jgi:lactam utilization protein B